MQRSTKSQRWTLLRHRLLFLVRVESDWIVSNSITKTEFNFSHSITYNKKPQMTAKHCATSSKKKLSLGCRWFTFTTASRHFLSCHDLYLIFRMSFNVFLAWHTSKARASCFMAYSIFGKAQLKLLSQQILNRKINDQLFFSQMIGPFFSFFTHKKRRAKTISSNRLPEGIFLHLPIFRKLFRLANKLYHLI